MDEGIFFFTFLSFLILLAVLGKLFAVDRRLKKLEKSLKTPEEKVVVPAPEKPAAPFGNRLTAPRESEQSEQSELAAEAGKLSGWMSRFWKWFCVGSQRDGVSAEYAAATTWLIRCGVVILLLAVGFFLKYSIENDLASPLVRVIGTFAAGIALAGTGLYGINKKYHQLCCGILSFGVVTLYMGAFAGYKLYALFPMAAAFAVMAAVTVAAMTAAVKLALLPVAVTGCAGAYLTPVLLSDGSGNVFGLTIYISIVSAGILIASRSRLWRVLEVMAFIMSFTLIAVSSGVHSSKVTPGCIAFLLVNFAVFSLIPVIRKKCDRNGLTELLLPMGSAAAALVNGLWMAQECFSNRSSYYAGAVIALIISIVTLAEAVWLRKNRSDSGKTVPAFLSASVIALAVALPCVLREPGSIASGFSILALMLMISAVYGRENTLLILGVVIYTILLPFAAEFRDGFSERFFFGGVYTISLLAAGVFLKFKASGKLAHDVKNICLTAGGAAFFVYTSVEVFQCLKRVMPAFRHGGVSVWWAIIAVILLTTGIRRSHKYLRAAGLLLFSATTVKVAAVDIASLNTLWKVTAFLLIGILFLGGAAAYIRFRRNFKK